MFTGIVSGIGQVTDASPLGGDSHHGLCLTVATPRGYLTDVQAGDSIALNGACMTVTRFDAAKDCFVVDVSAESLACTAGLAAPGPLNLEKALRANDRLGGHLVAGHVDGIGRVSRFDAVGESRELCIVAPRSVGRYLAFKGSVAVNGVSLTVNRVADSADSLSTELSINLIPHTLHSTTLATLVVGAEVNLEVDLIARYVERMLAPPAAA